MESWGSDPSTAFSEDVPTDGKRFGTSGVTLRRAIAGVDETSAGLEFVPPADGASNNRRRAD